MNKLERKMRLINRLQNEGFSFEEAQTLRRIEMTLSRWGELECGDGNDYGSWAIERDEVTDKPYMVRHHYRHGQGQDSISRTPIADREKGALRRLEKLMQNHPDFVSYHQGDPRGCCLYIVKKSDLNGSDINSTYTRGIAVCD